MSPVLQLVRDPEFSRANLQAAIDLLIAENRKLDQAHFGGENEAEKVKQLESSIRDLQARLVEKDEQLRAIVPTLQTHAGNLKLALRCFANSPSHKEQSKYFKVLELQVENMCEFLLSFNKNIDALQIW